MACLVASFHKLFHLFRANIPDESGMISLQSFHVEKAQGHLTASALSWPSSCTCSCLSNQKTLRTDLIGIPLVIFQTCFFLGVDGTLNVLLFQNFVDVQTPIGQMGHDGNQVEEETAAVKEISNSEEREVWFTDFLCKNRSRKMGLGFALTTEAMNSETMMFKPRCRIDSFRWVWTRFNLWHFEFPWCRCPKSFSRYTQPPWLPLPALFNQVELGPCRTDDATRGCCDAMYQSWYTVHLPPWCQHDMFYVHVSKIIQRISDWHSQMLRHTCLWEQSWSGRFLEYM